MWSLATVTREEEVAASTTTQSQDTPSPSCPCRGQWLDKLILLVTMLLTRVSAQRALGAAADLVRVHGGRPRHLPRPRRRGLRIRQEEVRE